MKVPVIVLSGFLGSGKTTLLIRLLHEAKQQSLVAAVLMNELGQQDVDGKIIADLLPNQSMEKLLDGCICCTKKSEIAGCIHNLLTRQPDLIIIELTGVANPEEIADAMTEPSVMHKVLLHRIVTVVNADFFLEYNSILNPDRALTHTLRRQVETADLLIINKKDLVRERTLFKVERAVRQLNPTAPIRVTVNAEADLTYVLQGIVARPRINTKSFNVIQPHQAHATPMAYQHSYSKLKTTSIPVPSNSSLRSQDLNRLSKSWGKGLLRAKGYIPVDGKIRLVQFSGGRLTIEPTHEAVEPYMVMIGFEADMLHAKESFEKHM